MSLERIKLLYGIAVIAIAIVLDCQAGILGWVTAVVMLAGALPMFRAITQVADHTGADEALNVVERFLDRRH